MKILVRYHDGAVPLTILPQGDWIDLCAAETVTMHAGEFRIISLGVSMQLSRSRGAAPDSCRTSGSPGKECKGDGESLFYWDCGSFILLRDVNVMLKNDTIIFPMHIILD